MHLASFRERANAAIGWAKLIAAHGDLLDGLEPVTKATDISGKGTFHRLYAGAFASPDEATGLCATLSARDVYCEVMKAGDLTEAADKKRAMGFGPSPQT